MIQRTQRIQHSPSTRSGLTSSPTGRLAALGLCLVALAAAPASASPTPAPATPTPAPAKLTPAPATLTKGLWSGGMGNLEDDGGRWDLVIVLVDEIADDRVSGRALFNEGETELTGSLRRDDVTLRFSRQGRRVTLEGRVEDGVLSGRCRRGASTESFLLVHEPDQDADRRADCAGMYAVTPEHKLIVRASYHLVLLDLARGETRVLYGRGGDRYVAGPSFGVPTPAQWTVTFERDDDEVTGLTLARGDGETLVARRCCASRSEDFSYRSDGTRIEGTLSLPEGPGPHPAVVWVHGSGRATRRGAGSWPWYFVDRGFAFLAVDKRGVGASGGTYELPDGSHDNRPHMERRAGDVRAAVSALATRDDIDAETIGLAGASQAGWVIPMAAGPGGVAFAVTLSGGATALSVENVFSEWAAEMDGGASAPSLDRVLKRVRRYRPRDPDFRAAFAAMPCPGLWLYGDRDRSNPSALCAELLEEVRAEYGKDFTVRRFPTGNHALMESHFGGAAEYGRLQRLVPGLHAAIDGWLEERGFVPGVQRD